MRLLAVDTSTDYLSVAVMSGEKTLARIHKKAPRSHSTMLVAIIDRVLKMSGTALDELDGFCLSIGPGSFTGLRIGAATVKTLAFVMKKPVVAVPTLDAIAQNQKKFRGIICVVLDARKNKVYAAVYRSDGKRLKKISKILLLGVSDLVKKLEGHQNVLFTGDFAEKAAGLLPGSKAAAGHWQPRPEVVGAIGAEYFKKRKFVKVEDLEPLYIYSRECDITGK
ncbi:MAG: tRNA (adenosine(37)-N6)-threonylcarbamoyltransferase complex dimerization subunit type 1 TsaB [Candidatus Omnitrophica bacterium]|nr:tRNA (adenosine(37)-N6)-threonylcarbamoyltransferase complex dimerization subunit type 1 TsaB [Candidatus Omnitrophota bacterium]MBU0880766.1 tRNA (adenosine(37)-N6)-threonylcarbamoyltransferase complex dimerization subunit type 1 TsaB [Candidatus Omnitrophota bacterium]MBU1038014.1 tRNA (adenosine(37)-N6)-threonylcarbamoyltransferase complex dimerization subunit type 1 TsaB [Candidatus Omnitrophota bacterium]MBU1808753.1 tRNA (adenosine(37)-N6)-threonylcarbamoyltransferase complex dimerizati